MLANLELAPAATAHFPANDAFPRQTDPPGDSFAGVQMLSEARPKQSASALSRMLASRLFDVSDAALVLADSEERIVSVNQHWTDLSGRETKMIEGRTLGENPVAGASEAIADLVHLARVSGASVSGSVDNKHVRGYSLGLEVRVIPLREDEDTAASGYLCIVKAAGLGAARECRAAA